MRVALLGWMGAVALVAACSGASNPLGGKSNAQQQGDAGGGGSGSGGSSGSSSGSSTSSGSGGSSSSSGGEATTCTNGSICNDGSAMQVCTTTGAGGKCASIRYTVDSTSFTCDGCSDCAVAQSQASQACAEAGSSSSGGGSGGGSGGSSSGSSSGSGSGSSSGGPVDAGDGDATCQAEVAASCVSCCQGLYATGVSTLIADIQACDCGVNGACQTACANEYCADGTVSVTGDACDVCLQASVDPDGGACLSTLQTECAADADCLSYITCTNGCPAQ